MSGNAQVLHDADLWVGKFFLVNKPIQAIIEAKQECDCLSFSCSAVLSCCPEYMAVR